MPFAWTYYLHATQVPRRPPVTKRRLSAHREAIAHAYRAGETIRAIAVRYGASPTTVRWVLADCGVSIRGRGRPRGAYRPRPKVCPNHAPGGAARQATVLRNGRYYCIACAREFAQWDAELRKDGL